MKPRRSVDWSGYLQSACAGSILLLAACGAGSNMSGMTAPAASNSTSSAAPAAGPHSAKTLSGVVHGGQAPITGSTLTLYVAGQPASTAPTQLDTTTTDAHGNFSFTGLTCPTAGALLYVVAAGGNAGGGNNSAIKLMAALGPCGSLPSSIVINELTTVAAVYALNAFSNISPSGTGPGGCVDCVPVTQSDMTQLHGNSPAINNAFNTTALLADVTTGQPARSLPPAGSCTAAGPPINCSALEKLTGLGNSLASCVNSSGASSAQCTTLFGCSAPVPRGANPLHCASDPTTSTDTLQAALSIARSPGLVGVSEIRGLATPDVVFIPGAGGSLNEWTIALEFTGGGLAAPYGIAVDAAGNVWVASFQGRGAVSEFNASGVPISPAAGFTGGGLAEPVAIAIDAAGNAWMANTFGNGSISELNSSGVPLSPATGFTAGGVNTPNAIAIDVAGNVWIANAGANSVSELYPSGAAVSPAAGFTGGGINTPVAIAIDGASNVWTANLNNSVSELNSSGMALSPAAGFTDGLDLPSAIAIDGAGNVWIANGANCASIDCVSSISEFNSSGTQMSLFPFTGVGGATSVPVLSNPAGIAIDGAGDVWVANAGNSSVTEFIGAAAPTVTPLVAQITEPAAALVSIAVTPTSAAATDGSTQPFTAMGTYADNSMRNISASVTWSSSNTSFATIAAGGLATCVAPGVVSMTASITQDGATITGTATQALTCSAPVVAGLACYAAPSSPGGGAQPYDNQSYCVSFSGTTDVAYSFTGTLSFTTPTTPGALINCQYWSSGTVTGVTGTQTTGPTPCTGTVSTSAGTPTLAIQDSSGNSFSGVFSGSSVGGSYIFGDFGPTTAAGGDATGTFSVTPPTT